MDKLSLSTLCEVVMPIYPKAPSYHIDDTYDAIFEMYNKLLTEVNSEDIVVMGDGTGGALALSFIQQLKASHQALPSKLYLISPLLDAQLDNKDITDSLDKKDVILDKTGIQRILSVWSQNLPLDDSRISPIYGELTDLPPVYMFGGAYEIYLPDMQRFANILADNSQEIHFYEYKKMVHAFPLLPIRESHKVVKQIVETLKH